MVTAIMHTGSIPACTKNWECSIRELYTNCFNSAGRSTGPLGLKCLEFKSRLSLRQGLLLLLETVPLNGVLVSVKMTPR